MMQHVNSQSTRRIKAGKPVLNPVFCRWTAAESVMSIALDDVQVCNPADNGTQTTFILEY